MFCLYVTGKFKLDGLSIVCKRMCIANLKFEADLFNNWMSAFSFWKCHKIPHYKKTLQDFVDGCRRGKGEGWWWRGVLGRWLFFIVVELLVFYQLQIHQNEQLKMSDNFRKYFHQNFWCKLKSFNNTVYKFEIKKIYWFKE